MSGKPRRVLKDFGMILVILVGLLGKVGNCCGRDGGISVLEAGRAAKEEEKTS